MEVKAEREPVEDVSRPIALHERAEDNLRYIRQAMARAGEFTAVPGWGGIAMGGSALVAAWVAHRAGAPGSRPWLWVWLAEMVVAIVLGGAAIWRKARRSNLPIFSGVGRKFVLSLLPALLVGGVLTIAMMRWALTAYLPGLWMLLYGAGIATGGAFSVKVVPITGVLFMIAGTITLFLPVVWADLLMAVSFGGLHVVFGWIIARKHGG